MFEVFPNSDRTAYVDSKAIAKLVNGVFWWMFTGILLTAVTVWGVATSPTLIQLAYASMWPVIIAQFGVAIAMSFFLNKISANTAKGLFIAYAILTGVTFSLFTIVFSIESILFCLGLTAAIFGVMAVYGYKTKEDLSKFGPILGAGLIVLIVTSIINLFLHIPMMSMVIAYIGVIIFTALIGFDVNRIKHTMIEMVSMGADNDSIQKYSVFGAFQIYLDFVNLFIYLLRIFGNKD